MKPVEPKTKKAPAVAKVDEPVSHSTERIKALPRVKPRGESVERKGRDRITLAIFLISVVILVGVGSFFLYAQFFVTNSEVINVENFGQKTATKVAE